MATTRYLWNSSVDWQFHISSFLISLWAKFFSVIFISLFTFTFSISLFPLISLQYFCEKCNTKQDAHKVFQFSGSFFLFFFFLYPFHSVILREWPLRYEIVVSFVIGYCPVFYLLFYFVMNSFSGFKISDVSQLHNNSIKAVFLRLYHWPKDQTSRSVIVQFLFNRQLYDARIFVTRNPL